MMKYEVIIIGAGPSGLFTACNINKDLNCLILEKNKQPGLKLLMSGAGQCNLTHGGNIKSFLDHYGEKGKVIRQILYKYNNTMLIDYFEKRGVPLFEREDGKVFPKSLDAKEILTTLINECNKNDVKIKYNHGVTEIRYDQDNSLYEVHTQNQTFYAEHVVVATGGCSYPTSGSDGGMFKVLKGIGLEIKKLKPALVPVYVENYNYGHLSGISLTDVKVSILRDEKVIAINKGDLLFTHQCISGPVILNISRYIQKGDMVVINYSNKENKQEVIQKLKKELNQSKQNFSTFIKEYFDLPKRLMDTLFKSCKIEDRQSSQVNHKDLLKVIDKIMSDAMKVDKLGGYNTAMVTSGGVGLEAIDLKEMEAKNKKSLYIVGEALDIDGDTGGYNLQFAFSSAAMCAKTINHKASR